MRRLPPLSAIRAFEAAARRENFTQAAAELGMTQAAVSYQIRLLEERLGLPLFARAKGRVTLTDAGRRIAPQIEAAFDSLGDAFAGLAEEQGGVLALTTAQTFATTWLAARLGSFQVAHPEIAVRLSTENKLVDFGTGEFDAAIRIGRGDWPGLRQHFLFRSHVTPICSPDFRDRHGLERPEQLLGLSLLAPEDPWWKSWLAEVGVDAGEVPPRPGLVLDNQVMEANAVLSGFGIAMMTPMFWRAELASGRLVHPFRHVYRYGSCYWLVYPEAKRTQPKIVAFRDWLLREVKVAAAGEPPELFDEPQPASLPA